MTCYYCIPAKGIAKMEELKVFGIEDKSLWEKTIFELPIDKQDIYLTYQFLKLESLTKSHVSFHCFYFKKDNNFGIYTFLKRDVNQFKFLEGKLNEQYYDIESAYGYGGAVFSTHDPKFEQYFYEKFFEWQKQNNIIASFSRFHPILINYANIATTKLFDDVIFDRNTVSLDLTQGFEKIWESEFSSKNRNVIRKAKKNGLTIQVSEDPSKFIEVYHQTMERLHALDLFYYNQSYFDYIFSSDFKETTYLLEVVKEDQVIGGLILFIFGDYCHYHLSARDENFKSLAVSNFALSEAIKFGISKGCKIMHFGGGNSSSEKDTLFRFKTSFSKELKEFVIAKKVVNKEVYDFVCKEWENENPDKAERFKHFLLKYHY